MKKIGDGKIGRYFAYVLIAIVGIAFAYLVIRANFIANTYESSRVKDLDERLKQLERSQKGTTTPTVLPQY